MNTFVFHFFFISTLILTATSYLEFKLVRMPKTQRAINYGIVQCLTDLPVKKSTQTEDFYKRVLVKSGSNLQEQQQGNSEDESINDDQDSYQTERKKVEQSDDFREICFQKDMSYAIQLVNERREVMLLSVDTTAPISWIKSDKCIIAETHKPCTRVESHLGEQTSKIIKKIQQMLKNPFHRNRNHNKKKKSSSDQYALIEGSSQVVKGTLEKTQTLAFNTLDSGRLTRISQVLLLGLAYFGLNSVLKFQNTTFIQATQISPALNFLCDGAISLRFDENSQSSFLKEMSALAQTKQTYVTLFIGSKNQTMTVGDLTVKFSAQGLSAVHWIPIEQNSFSGKLPKCSQISLSDSDNDIVKSIKAQFPLVLTLSSSTITIPEQQLKRILQKFFPKSSCTFQQTTRYVKCDKLSISDIETRELNFLANETTIMIPFKDLVLSSKKHQITFNIKPSLDSRYIILGEPIFKKYFIILDYEHNRVGVSLQRTKFVEPLINVVVLIRFVVWAFILGLVYLIIGCCCICFALPMQRCFKVISDRMISGKLKKKGKQQNSDKRRINDYRALDDENPYEDIRGKIQQIIEDENHVRAI